MSSLVIFRLPPFFSLLELDLLSFPSDETLVCDGERLTLLMLSVIKRILSPLTQIQGGMKMLVVPD